jgi:flavin-dependent dehydrogenase
MADLELKPSEYPHTIQAFDTVYVGYDDKLRETHWSEPASFGIVRKEFDTFLLRRAKAAGAEVREGVRVRAVDVGAESVRVDVGEEWLEGKMVVGAGGHTCPIARTLGNLSGNESVVLTQESETEIGAEILTRIAPNYGFPELFAEPDFNGYAWYFTKGGYLNIGVGCLGKNPSVHERRNALLERLKKSGRLTPDLELTPFKGHAYSIRRAKARNVAGPRFVLVGDAAGLAKDFSGEGIGPAVRSARMASETILAWLDGLMELERYAQKISETYGHVEEGLMDRIVERLPDKMIHAVAKFICGNSWLRRRVVLEGAFGIG